MLFTSMLTKLRNSKITKFSITPLTLLFMAVVTLSACDTTSSMETTSSSYDGKALFQGLYFGEGEAASEFSTIWNNQRVVDQMDKMTDAQRQELRQIQSRAIDWIETNQKGFFSDFQTALQSGDHLEIKKKLDESSAVLKSALIAVTDLTADSIDSPNQMKEEACAVLVVVLAVVAVVAVAVAVAVRTEAKAESQLQQEQLINEIAVNLAV